MTVEFSNLLNELVKINKELSNHLGHIYMELYALQCCIHNGQYCKTCKDNYEKYKHIY